MYHRAAFRIRVGVNYFQGNDDDTDSSEGTRLDDMTSLSGNAERVPKMCFGFVEDEIKKVSPLTTFQYLQRTGDAATLHA